MRLLILALLLAACGKNEGDAPTPKSTHSGAMEEARRIYTAKCQMCHGPEGRGDGPMAANLTPRPRDFHSPSFQSSVTDDQIVTIISKGGAAVGKSPSMTPNPDLSPELLAALKDIVRSHADPVR